MSILFPSIVLVENSDSNTNTRTSEQVTYFHNDASGSPMRATDANDNLVWK
ncbi:MAG: hypothetical protein WAO12_10860 [Venatoribacter sp.]